MADKINQPPLQISPIIKVLRWSCLMYGVVYGFLQRRKYAAIEKVIREEDERERPAREARLALEKKLHNEAEMKELERIFLGTSSSEKQTDEGTLESEERDEDKKTMVQLPEKEERIILPEPDEEESMESDDC
ncbi:hypothetical protein ANTPLA_LOCUS8400 [Anthophora plagiata]